MDMYKFIYLFKQYIRVYIYIFNRRKNPQSIFINVCLTVRIMQRLSRMAPQHPKKAMMKIIEPMAIRREGTEKKLLSRKC